jgi:hypothetical protein
MGRMSSHCYAIAYPLLPYVVHQSTSCSVLWHLWDGTHSNTPAKVRVKRRQSLPGTVLTVLVINAPASAYSDLPHSSLVFSASSRSHRALSRGSRDFLLMICHLFRTPGMAGLCNLPSVALPRCIRKQLPSLWWVPQSPEFPIKLVLPKEAGASPLGIVYPLLLQRKPHVSQEGDRTWRNILCEFNHGHLSGSHHSLGSE